MDRMGLVDKKQYINGDVVLVNLKETRGKISFLSFINAYAQNRFKCWDQDVITYCFNSYIKFQNSYKSDQSERLSDLVKVRIVLSINGHSRLHIQLVSALLGIYQIL